MKSSKFQQKVYKLLKKIPSGKITTYKLLARAVGKPKNWRQIGHILSQNPYSRMNADQHVDIRKSISVNQRQYQRKSASRGQCTFPCYKVVKSNGEVGGYNCGKLAKIRCLRKDGIIVYNNKINDFKKYIFKNF